MAKEQIIRIKDMHNFKIEASGTPGVCNVTISGKNSKGTLVRISGTMEDYFLSYIVEGINTVSLKRVKDANRMRTDIVNALKEENARGL